MNAPSKVKEATLVASAVSGFLFAHLGWVGVLVLIWVGAMALDYLTGTFAAMKAHEWSSSVARTGLWHKAGSIAVVLIAACADFTIKALTMGGAPIPEALKDVLLPLVLTWYILTEAGSVMENAAKLGAPAPKWMKNRIDTIKDTVDKAAGNTTEKGENQNE